jgi:hypothetical protein
LSDRLQNRRPSFDVLPLPFYLLLNINKKDV